MLTIQPTKTAFEGHRYDRHISREEREYQKNYDELLNQKEEFLDLANSEDFKMPKTAKKVLEGGAILTTGLLGGMATGWGAKKSIQGFSKLSKTAAVKDLKKHALATKEFVKTSSKSIKEIFVESDAYKMPAGFIKKHYNKFANTKFGKPVIAFFEAVGNGVKAVYKRVKTGINYIVDKIKGIDKAKAEKAAVNTVAVSGGVASGVTAIKEKQQAGEE